MFSSIRRFTVHFPFFGAFYLVITIESIPFFQDYVVDDIIAAVHSNFPGIACAYQKFKQEISRDGILVAEASLGILSPIVIDFGTVHVNCLPFQTAWNNAAKF